MDITAKMKEVYRSNWLSKVWVDSGGADFSFCEGRKLLHFLKRHVCCDPKEGRPWRDRTRNESLRWEDVVLRHGQFWPFKHLPGIHAPRKDGAPDYYQALPRSWCHANSLHLILADARLTYVEGFACNNAHGKTPLPHAWVVDQDGTIIDSTWCADNRIETDGGMYFGVPFSGEWLMSWFSKFTSGYLGMWRSVFEHFDRLPDLKGRSQEWLGRPGEVKDSSLNRRAFFGSSGDPTLTCIEQLVRLGCHRKTSDIQELIWETYEQGKINFSRLPPRSTRRLGKWLSDNKLALAQTGIKVLRVYSGHWLIRACDPLVPEANQSWRDLIPANRRS